jgi:hypothetical protein
VRAVGVVFGRPWFCKSVAPLLRVMRLEKKKNDDLEKISDISL